MKKACLIIIMGFAVSSFCFPVDFNIYGGMNIYPPAITAAVLSDSNPIGFLAGAGVYFDIDKELKIGPDVCYIQLLSVNEAGVGDFTLNMVPVLLNLYAEMDIFSTGIGLGVAFPFIYGTVTSGDIPLQIDPTFIMENVSSIKLYNSDPFALELGMRVYLFYDSSNESIPFSTNFGVFLGMVF